jgi:hypothetical protein
VWALCCLPGAARAASEVDILLDKLVEKQVLTAVEAGLIRREIAETKEARNKELAQEMLPASSVKWTWKGDLRLRDEIRNRLGTGTDNHRQRIRFRYGVDAKVSDEIKVGARIATGSSADFESGSSSTNSDIQRADPISTNDSFDDFFRKKPIVLDLAYLQYSPAVPGVSKFSVVGGIMENPLWSVTPMVWDGDLSWDGVAMKAATELGPAATAFVNSGAFSLDTDETEAASLWVAQGGVTLVPFPNAGPEQELAKNLKLTAAVAYHDYRNTANADAGTDPLTRESDNTTAAHDFDQLNPSVELASVIGGYPVALFGDWVHNTSVIGGANDNGYAVGGKVGKASVPFSWKNGWEAGYFFERLETDAAFDEFVDSDFGGGGTNRKGHVVWLTLATLKNSTLGVKFFAGEQVTGAKFREDRTQVDWITKF